MRGVEWAPYNRENRKLIKECRSTFSLIQSSKNLLNTYFVLDTMTMLNLTKNKKSVRVNHGHIVTQLLVNTMSVINMPRRVTKSKYMPKVIFQNTDYNIVNY